MTTLEDTQAALISYLKSLNLGVPSVEIRERQWQGVNFSYPAIRTRIETFRDDGTTGCSRFIATGNVMCFSEIETSLQANQIATSVFQSLNRRSFSHNLVKFVSFQCTQVGAQRVEETSTWVSEVKFQVMVS